MKFDITNLPRPTANEEASEYAPMGCMSSIHIYHSTDFTCQDLRMRDLDNTHFFNCSLEGADLTGANLSESRLIGCNLSGARLVDTCMVESEFASCNFSGAEFGATDMRDALISDCRFSTPYFRRLDLHGTRIALACTLTTGDGGVHAFTRPPLMLAGPAFPVLIFDHSLMVGDMSFMPCAAQPDPQRFVTFLESVTDPAFAHAYSALIHDLFRAHTYGSNHDHGLSKICVDYL